MNFFKKINLQKASYALPVILILLFILILPSFFFSIDPEEDGVVLKFGEYHRTVGPGLHLKFPIGIEKVMKVRTRSILKEEFGFQTSRADVRTQYNDSRSFDGESLMLTGDLNVADVEWIIQYKISSARDYLFNVREIRTNLRDLSEAVMRQVVGDLEVNEVLTYGRLEIEEAARSQLQQVLDEYKTGIQIVTVKLQDVNPPEAVKPSFNEVNAAKQEADQLINEAWKAYNKVIPEAKGKASQTIAVAEGYAIEQLNRAKGDTSRFSLLEEEFSKAPQITQKRIYLESMQEILSGVEKVYIMDSQAIVPFMEMKGKKE